MNVRHQSDEVTAISAPRDPNHGVEVIHVAKRYRVVLGNVGRIRGFFFWRVASHHQRRDLWALDDVTFDVRRGEIVGVVGPNGAGKSTLLRVISGITVPDRGIIRRGPRVAAILDLSVGFHPSLTGYENIFLTGSLLGIPRAEMRQRLPEIIAFSGLDPAALDQPIRHFSSGMTARLGFALAVHTDPDVVLVDEVLAVGDSEFQVRSAQRLLRFSEEGRSMILVSHMVDQIEHICSRTLWLDHGRVVEFGPTREVTREYRRFLNKQIHHYRLGRRDPESEIASPPAQNAPKDSTPQAASAPISVNQLILDDGEGHPSSRFRTGEPMRVRALLKANQPVRRWNALITIFNEVGEIVDDFTLTEKGLHPPAFSTAMELRVLFAPLLLYRGHYTLDVEVFTIEDVAANTPALSDSAVHPTSAPNACTESLIGYVEHRETPFEVDMDLDGIQPMVYGTMPFDIVVDFA